MAGETPVVGRNMFQEGIESPLVAGDGGIFKVDPKQAKETLSLLEQVKNDRNEEEAAAAIAQLEEDARSNVNLFPASIRCAKAMVTTGEWMTLCAAYLVNIGRLLVLKVKNSSYQKMS